MSVNSTTQFQAEYTFTTGSNYQQFVSNFSTWFNSGKPDNLALFGKDVAYVLPIVSGKKYTLRHVHLFPVGDPVATNAWIANVKRSGAANKRTSEIHLIYVEAGSDALILYYLSANAHALAGSQSNPSQLLKNLVPIAERWLNTGLYP